MSRLVPHDRGGMPAVYCEEVVRPILDALRTANHRNTAARVGGIASSTFNRWMIEHPEFAAAVEEAEAECERGLVTDLMRLARGLAPAEGRVKPDSKAVTFLLERRFSERWKERTEVAVKVEHVDVETLEQKWADTVVEGEVVSIRALPVGRTENVDCDGLEELGETEPGGSDGSG